MAKYQVQLVVDIEADDADAAWEIAENLESFLGQHYQTASSGLAQEVLEVEDAAEEEDTPLTEDLDELTGEEDVMAWLDHEIDREAIYAA